MDKNGGTEMNWKDVPHLFANGKFNVKSPRIITGKFDGIEEGEVDSWVIYSRGQVAMLDECTLIARKIEDMTDNECHKVIRIEKYDSSADILREYSNEVTVNPKVETFLYMLSIGVYPFDQSHFGESVIDSKTL